MTNIIIIIINVVWACVLIGVMIPLTLVIWCLVKKQRHQSQEYLDLERQERVDARGVLLYSLPTLNEATANFSIENRIGNGGFGVVYKGVLRDGREIAVKRLSNSSKQGNTEFEAEVGFMSTVPHANVIQMYGYCRDGEEKLLVYEFLSNKSLDHFIFDENEIRREPLGWIQRLQIIRGIAEGLLHLHEPPEVIVHLDMKPHNILLDANMNPKIADFGMAKKFDIDKSRQFATHLIGTERYMAPEYKRLQIYSTKTDIYSFGVLVLEILSGRQNILCIHLDRELNLVGHAWEMWVNGEVVSLKDPKLGDTCNEEEFMRTFNVALLCVQEEARDRPSASELVTMLSLGGELTRPVIPSFMRD